MATREIKSEIVIPETVTVTIEDGLVKVKGEKGELQRALLDPKINITVKDRKVLFLAPKGTKREKTKIGTFASHAKNMVQGVQSPHVYKLKICSGHFPMNVSTTKEEFVIKNFLGEKIPRTVKIKPNVTVKLDKEIVTVESTDKELAGQTAADIEQLTKVRGRDLRIFQDGIYITDKCGKQIK